MAKHSPTATAIEAAPNWAEDLDVDDSDLHPNPPSSLPLPFLRPCISTPTSHPSRPPPAFAVPRRRIPGPASSVQASMRRRSPSESPAAAAAAAASARDEVVLDADFQLNPWLCAVRFLGEERGWERPGIGEIGVARALHRAPLVVGVVKSCKPNGLGDLFLTLKDPTGTVDASVHRKVLLEGSLGKDISVGCVIVLKQVVVFRPSRAACYLNVTLGNVVKVMGRDCGAASKEVFSSFTAKNQPAGKCTETGRVSHQGHDLTARRAAAETSETTARNFSGIFSQTNNASIAEVVCDNSGAANAPSSTILRMDKGTSAGLENCQNTVLHEIALGPQSKHVPNHNANKQLQNILDSIRPASTLQSQGGSSAMYESNTAGGSSRNEKEMGLLDGERVTSISKSTVAEVSCGHNVIPSTSNSNSGMDTDAVYGSEKDQEIGFPKIAGGSHVKRIQNHNCNEHRQQNLSIPDMRSSQSSINETSVMFENRDSNKTTGNEKLRWPFEGSLMVPSSKRQRIDEVLPDDNGSVTNKNFSVSCMGTETNCVLEKHLNIRLDDEAEELHSQCISNRKADVHYQQDFCTANVGNVQPSLQNSSSSVTSAAHITGPMVFNPGNDKNEPKKSVSMVSGAQWTDEQLAELFADY